MPRDVKDEGLDFAAWIHHLDDRPGHLFLLGQCACGDNWSNKLTELSIDPLMRWFPPMCHVPATRAFCTPFHITDQRLIEASKQAGIVFDRIRLTLLAETASDDIQGRAGQTELGAIPTRYRVMPVPPPRTAAVAPHCPPPCTWCA